MNNGTCYVNGGRVICDCQAGYTGVLCQIEIDFCNTANYPCLHGGTCNRMVNNYSCSCTEYYEGWNCSDGKLYHFLLKKL